MITLHKKEGDEFAVEVHKALEALVIRYDVVTLKQNSSENTHVTDGEKTIEGKSDIREWLRKLESDLRWQRSLSGDGCYIDPKTGEVC